MAKQPIIHYESWQNQPGSLTTIPGIKSVQAADVLAGFRGSWAGFHGLGPQVSGLASISNTLTPAQEQYKAYRLGQPGSPEINFAPFEYYTNRLANRGGSLVGHPLSFEVIGPTLKTPNLYWQWLVTDNSGTPGLGDVLELDVDAANMLDSAGNPYTVAGLTISELFGVTSVEGTGVGTNGLYLVISQSGANAAVDANPDTGLPDGYVRATIMLPRLPLSPLTTTSKLEIFRVVDIQNDHRLILDPGKRLADYFDIPATPAVRAITLLEPKVTRLMPLPDSGLAGSETDFLFILPERSARSELWSSELAWTNPLMVGGLDEDPWMGTMNAAVTLTLPGTEADYRFTPAMPIPRPLRTQVGRLLTDAEAGVAPACTNIWASYGQWHVVVDPLVASSDDVNKIIHIYEVQVTGDAILRETPAIAGAGPVDTSDLTGWYEIVFYEPPWYALRRVPEVDPHTGRIRYGAPDRFILDAAVASGNIYLFFTVHDNISSLWDTAQFDIDQVESARVKNIIDPSWVQRTLKHPDEAFPGDPARADKAIFDTSSQGTLAAGGNRANPGNLMDLGFRVVLYPATIRGNELIPDMDRPISSLDVPLNATDTGEQQYIEIDYSNGILRLSHSVDETSPLYPSDPDVFTHTDNPRGELVLYAACVPYSLEPGQLGTAVRVTGGGITTSASSLVCGGTSPASAQADLYGNRVVFALTDQTITSRQDNSLGANDITLAGDQMLLVPYMGFVEILSGTGPDGDPAFTYAATPDVRVSTFGYHGVSFGGGNTTLHNCYGGGVAADTFVVSASNPGVAVLRKDIYTPLIPNVWRPGTDYQSDVTFGSAKRNLTLRFEGASLQGNADGSVTVATSEVLALSHQNLFDNLFSSWVLTGCDLVGTISAAGGDYILPYNAGTILVQGRYVSLPAGEVAYTSALGTRYIYIDGADALTSCYPYKVTATVPLPDVQDILVAKVVVTAGPTVVVTDLRYPLQDVDRRTDIFVGSASTWIPGSAHFATLWEAVAYANEIMEPTGVGSDFGRQLRIRVVGKTTEPDDRVPIQIKCSGLFIEGNGATDLNIQNAIEWGAQESSLIDLNGYSDLTFRGLYMAFEPAGDAKLTPLRMAFTNSSDTTSSRVVIEDCFCTGDVQGFAGFSAGGLANSTIQRNTAPICQDFGIYMATSTVTAAECTHNVFAGNVFTQSIPGNMTTSAGIYLCEDGLALKEINLTTGTDYTQGTGFKITGNYLFGFQQSIAAWVDRSTIRDNYCSNTKETGGICVGENITVQDNFFRNVHTDPAPAVNRYGLIVGGKNAKSAHNFVDLAGGTAIADYSIQYRAIGTAVGDTSGNPGIHSQDNNATADASGRIRVSVSNTTLMNEVTYDLLVDDGVSGTMITGGWYGLVQSPDGDRFSIEGAEIINMWVNSKARVTNCYIQSLVEGGGVAAEGCKVIGCEILYLNDLPGGVLLAQGSRFEGNTFLTPGTISGDGNIFTGNDVTGNMVRDDAGASTSGNAFTVSGARNNVATNKVFSDVDHTGLEITGGSGNIVMGNNCDGFLQVSDVPSSVVGNQAKKIYYLTPTNDGNEAAAVAAGGPPTILQQLPAIGNLADVVFGVAGPANTGNDHNPVSPL